MKTYEQLVAGILTQVLDDIEDERVRQGKKRIVLNCTLPYPKIVADISQSWEKELSEGKKVYEGVEIIGYEVVDLYPSLKLEFTQRVGSSIYMTSAVLDKDNGPRSQPSSEPVPQYY